MEKRTVINIDEIVVFSSEDSTQFIDFVECIAIENGDLDMTFLSTEAAESYINTYCDDLTLS